MRDFTREGAAGVLVAHTPDQAARFRDFMQRGVVIHRGGALWRIEGERSQAQFSLSHVRDLKPAHDPFAHAGGA